MILSVILPFKDPKKRKEYQKKWEKANREKRSESNRKWKQRNPELVKSYRRKSNERNPTAKTEDMTKYRRNQRECEWSDCDQTKSLHVHHVLPQHKYPEYVDGDYHGRIGNNFICFCSFHHFSYHHAYATKRNDKKHQNATKLLWAQSLQWIDGKKISAEDLEIEISQMLPAIA